MTQKLWSKPWHYNPHQNSMQAGAVRMLTDNRWLLFEVLVLQRYKGSIPASAMKQNTLVYLLRSTCLVKKEHKSGLNELRPRHKIHNLLQSMYECCSISKPSYWLLMLRCMIGLIVLSYLKLLSHGRNRNLNWTNWSHDTKYAIISSHCLVLKENIGKDNSVIAPSPMSYLHVQWTMKKD